VAPAAAVERLVSVHPETVVVSAVTGEGIEALLEEVSRRLEGVTVDVELTIPYERGDLVSSLHDLGEILEEQHSPEGTRLVVRLQKRHVDRFHEFA
jgi:GTP-binding protein HflX